MNQYCYFDVLPIAMNNSVYRGIAGKIVDPDSNDMMIKVKVD
jgi:hypothetical protein